MYARLSGILLAPLLLCATLADANPLDEAARLVEEAAMERLHAQQTRPGVTIDSFHSDGCSGGLSDSWKTLARIWPEWARSIGKTPPWESCCVTHDRAYWRGESIDGFERRLQADLDLRLCVEQSGDEQSADIARRLGINEADVVEVFYLTADLMFHAVRIGGGPCTGLVWRWGHGWPPCDVEVEASDGQLVRIPPPAADFPVGPTRFSAVDLAVADQKMVLKVCSIERQDASSAAASYLRLSMPKLPASGLVKP